MTVEPVAGDLADLSPSAVSLRGSWDDLPATVVAAIESNAGPVERVQPARDGYSSHVAATVWSGQDRVFVKGLRTDHPAALAQGCEVAVNPFVVPLGPKVLWRVEADGWDVLGFEYLEGRRAEYHAGSTDLPLVVDAMAELGAVAGQDAPVPRAEQRWAPYLDDPATARLLHGDTLLHTDWHHTNMLVTPTGHVRLVDWATATRGAAWIDPACWVVWLVYAGNSPRTAEQWAERVPAWRSAEPGVLDAFADVLARYWQYVAVHHPNRMTGELRDASAQWAAYRRSAGPAGQ
ncbi:phosphotransferase family protein [Kitasatospora sp. NPDC087314]|uniref:phosphotransferase family protein n=1 Tax=Kitasatospora sp. NPDC087314 TaxID=3364068 RepID=UPI00380D1EBD